MSTASPLTTPTIDRLGWEILNAMADDGENLEQMYRSICFELVSNAQSHQEYRPVSDAPKLWEIVEHLRELVQQGLTKPVCDEEGRPWTSNPNDVAALWKAWFVLTPHGQAMLAAPMPA